MKGLVFDDDLNFVMGYGDARSIKVSGEASSIENFQWFSFGKSYRYKLPALRKEGAILEAINALATTLNATLSVDRDIVSIQDRSVKGAVTAFPVSASDTTLFYEFANMTLPDRGYLLIGAEVMRYTG